MSTVTKIFTVLLVVFSIAFSMVSISFVAQTNDWRELARGYQQEALAADTYLRNSLASAATQAALDRDALNARIQQIKALETNNQENLRQIAELRTGQAQARSELGSLQATLRTLTGELKIGQAGWTEQYKQRTLLENRNVDLEKRNLDLNDRVNELTSQVVVFQQNVRQLEQKLHILEEENRNLADARQRAGLGEVLTVGGPSLDSARPATPVAQTPIRGTVTRVDGSLATISVGTADGVAEGMVFVVYRGLEYVADLKISKVEPNVSAGTIMHSRGRPRIGDQVADEARFGFAD